MAMTLRLSEQEEATLNRIVDKVDGATKSKTITWMINHWEEQEELTKSYLEELNSKKRELAELRKFVAAYLEKRSEAEEIERLLHRFIK